MFLPDTFIIVIVALLAALAGQYYFGVFSSVLDHFRSDRPDYDDRAAELAETWRRKTEQTIRELETEDTHADP